MRFAIALALFGFAAAPVQEHGGKIDWVRDAEFGLAKAAHEGRAAMLYFTADW